MKLASSLLGALLVFSVLLPAQETTPSKANSEMSSTPQSASPRIAAGSVIPVQLTKTIDAKKAKTGESVEAKVTQDMKSNSGEVIMAKDTKMVGHVTQVQPHTKEQKESELGITFDHAVMKDGATVALPMSIQAIIGSQALNAPTATSNAGNENPSGPYSGNPGPGAPMGGGGSQSRSMPSPSGTSEPPSAPQSESSGRPPITGNTQGVVGIPDLNLAAGTNPSQGSVLTSEKNNVKLEGGTLMLLRVNQ